MVCLGVYFACSARDMVGRILGIFIPVCMFATCGFEHVIANMFYIPLAMMYGANISFIELLWGNLIPATLGNIIGGGGIVGAGLVVMYVWEQDCVEVAVERMWPDKHVLRTKRSETSQTNESHSMTEIVHDTSSDTDTILHQRYRSSSMDGDDIVPSTDAMQHEDYNAVVEHV